ncbi:helix-turn-helix domain-containing protein [Lacrimispora sp. JR3]|uniref:helix-turn-helix domain-containing protein n=1 Tax=Lacrimispora sinapis TaxID=3111456 RepID=UPI00374A62B5
MKLSMWMLAHWLKRYSPEVQIVNGGMVLKKLRIVSGNQKSDNREVDKTALLIQSSVGFQSENTDKEEILLSNCGDSLRLLGYPQEVIVNEISSAFAYYNDWEERLRLAAGSAEPEQNIIDECTSLFGPIFLIDMEMRKIAMSAQYGAGTVSPVWDELLAKGVSSFHVMEKLRNTWFFNNYTSLHKCSVTEIENVEEVMPYNKCIIISQVNDMGEVIGQMLISSKDAFEMAKLQLATVIYEVLSTIRPRRPSTSNKEVVSNFFSSMLYSSEQKKEYQSFIYSVNCWSPKEEYCVVVFKKTAAQILVNAKTTLSMISDLLEHCIITHEKEYITACINVTRNSRYQQQIQQICTKRWYVYGMSFVFEGMESVYEMKKQAMLALAGNRSLFSEVAFDSLIHSIEDQNFVIACIHPALRKLKNYDQENHTQLLPTLKVFLQCERSWVRTAEELELHRNTIISRMSKISELLCLDFDDADEREYLLYSFRILASRNE